MSFENRNDEYRFYPHAINERPSISAIPITTNDCNQNNIDDWYQWFAQTQPFEQNRSFNMPLKKIIDDGYNIINYIIDYISSLTSRKQSVISSKSNSKCCNDENVEIKRLKNELTKMTSKLKKVNMRNERLQKQIKQIKKQLTKKNKKHEIYDVISSQKENEIVRLKTDNNTLGSLLPVQCIENKKFEKMQNEYKESDHVITNLKDENQGHYEVILTERDKTIETLQKDNNTLGAQLAMEAMQNRKLIKVIDEYKETDQIMMDLKGEISDLKEEMIDLQEKLRKKCNELRNIKGNNNYLMWNGDDIVDWMILRENGRFRIYENTLRENMKIECISGKQLRKLSLNDVHRLGIKHFEDKKTMFGYIKELIKNNKNMREDPDELCDPITFELMKDPVLVTVSGRTYDRKTIKNIIKKGDKEPFSGHKINNKHLISNKLVKEFIVKYKNCKIIINP